MFLLALIASTFAADYEYFATWRVAPDVVYCENSNIEIEYVQDAIEYWKSRGHEFGEISTRKHCDGKPEKYVIKFAPADDTIDTVHTYGHTELNWTYRYLDNAVIKLSHEGMTDYEVVVHETGHALGIDHYHVKTDIMYERHKSYHTHM
tara:strand:+ start:670 stop:1116 length:447 start_codon:yes stop_codon:yes gene_type:complete